MSGGLWHQWSWSEFSGKVCECINSGTKAPVPGLALRSLACSFPYALTVLRAKATDAVYWKQHTLFSLESWQQKAAPANRFKSENAGTEVLSLRLSNSHNNCTLHHSTFLWSFGFGIKPVVFPNYFSKQLLRAVMGVLGDLRVVSSAAKNFSAAENLHFLWQNLLFVEATKAVLLHSVVQCWNNPCAPKQVLLAFSKLASMRPLQKFSWKLLAWCLMGEVSLLEHWCDSILKNGAEQALGAECLQSKCLS